MVALLTILLLPKGLAQDRLFFINGVQKEVKITEVTPDQVKYKQLDNMDGPIFIALKSNLSKIVYSNGEEELIECIDSSSNENPSYESLLDENKRLKNALSIDSDVDKWGRTA